MQARRRVRADKAKAGSTLLGTPGSARREGDATES